MSPELFYTETQLKTGVGGNNFNTPEEATRNSIIIGSFREWACVILWVTLATAGALCQNCLFGRMFMRSSLASFPIMWTWGLALRSKKSMAGYTSQTIRGNSFKVEGEVSRCVPGKWITARPCVKLLIGAYFLLIPKPFYRKSLFECKFT